MAEHSKLVPVAGPANALLDYPPERLYVRWAAPASVGFHLLIGLIFLALVYLHHIKNLRDLMTASITQLPADQIQILLIDENKPPPPTDHPLWIKQLIIPKVKPPPPPRRRLNRSPSRSRKLFILCRSLWSVGAVSHHRATRRKPMRRTSRARSQYK